MAKRFISLVFITGVLLIGFLLWSTPDTDEAPYSLTDFLSNAAEDEQAESYIKAVPDYRLQFPQDHQAHSGFRSEWWYINGNLQHRDKPDQRYGFQFTLFRQALAPTDKQNDEVDSRWLQPQFYMGHAGLGDFQRGTHHSAERFSRQGPGLAGTSVDPLVVWLESWRLDAEQPDNLFPATIQMQDRDTGIAYKLRLIPEKPKILQGIDGYSPKRPEPGFASYYYSYTRLRVEGEITLQGDSIPVTGAAWYDHEWSSNSLAPYQTGWDWFALQLEDGRDLMFMVLRSKTGWADFQQVSLVDVSGERLPLADDQVQLEILDHWTADDGVRYPSGWRIRIPSYDLDLKVIPRKANQDNLLSVRYWEGAVEVSGSHAGQGYVELTGYE